MSKTIAELKTETEAEISALQVKLSVLNQLDEPTAPQKRGSYKKRAVATPASRGGGKGNYGKARLQLRDEYQIGSVKQAVSLAVKQANFAGPFRARDVANRIVNYKGLRTVSRVHASIASALENLRKDKVVIKTCSGTFVVGKHAE